VAFKKDPKRKIFPFVIIYDFLGFYPMTKSLKEKMGVYFWNYFWSKDYKKETRHFDLGLFVGEPEDIPDERFGMLLPNRRDYAQKKYKFIGYVLPFKPEDYKNNTVIKKELGYGPEPLIICSIGGTAIGKELLNLCADSYPIIQKKIPNIRMILNCGPRLDKEAVKKAEGIEVMGFIPDLYKHFAACDLAVVQAGGTTTLELTALNKPFIYFPLEKHCEQFINVKSRLNRHNAGIYMKYSETTPESLAEKIIENYNKQTDYETVPVDGAKKAAELICVFL